MSNLNLPTMTYESLDSRLGFRYRMKLAYATEAVRWADTITIEHHGSLIARLHPNGDVELTHAGWASMVTTNRLNIIARANQIQYVFSIRNGNVCLVRPDTRRIPEAWLHQLPSMTARFHEGVLLL